MEAFKYRPDMTLPDWIVERLRSGALVRSIDGRLFVTDGSGRQPIKQGDIVTMDSNGGILTMTAALFKTLEGKQS